MSGACGGRYSFVHEDDRLRTAAIAECEPFARELAVVAIEGHRVAEAGDLALAAACRRCAPGRSVTFALADGGTVRIPCPTPPPAEPRPLGFPGPASESGPGGSSGPS